MLYNSTITYYNASDQTEADYCHIVIITSIKNNLINIQTYRGSVKVDGICFVILLSIDVIFQEQWTLVTGTACHILTRRKYRNNSVYVLQATVLLLIQLVKQQ